MMHSPNPKGEPLNATPSKSKLQDLNATLDPTYLDIPDDDYSFMAKATRAIAGYVGMCCSPRRMLIFLRLLKAITFAFLCLTLIADLMYIFFVELFVSDEITTKVGGSRDTIIRVYGLILTIVAIAIEMDIGGLVKHFQIFKGFIPRAFLLFFIATVTNANPLHDRSHGNTKYYFDNEYSDEEVSQEIPGSTIVFQMVTSVVLGACSLVYLFFGFLCFDRFTSKAFLSKRDPVESTAIPAAPGGYPQQGNQTPIFEAA